MNKKETAQIRKTLHTQIDRLLDQPTVQIHIINKIDPVYVACNPDPVGVMSRGQILIIETGTHELHVNSISRFVQAKTLLPNGTEIELK